MPNINFNNNNSARLSSNVPNLTGSLSNTVIQSSADMSNYYDKEEVDGLLENKSDTDHDHYIKASGLFEYNLQEAFDFLKKIATPESQVKWLIGQYAALKDHEHYVKLGIANLSLHAAYDGLKKELKDLRDTVSQLVTVVEPKSEYYVEYTVAEPMATFNMGSTEPTVSSEGYLPIISGGALFTKINLKDGSATVNMNTKISDVESIRIYYPEDNNSVQFHYSNVKSVNHIKANNLDYLHNMFFECPNLEYADLRSLNIDTLSNCDSLFSNVPSEAEIRMPVNTPKHWNNYGFAGQFVYDITGYTVSPAELTITNPGTYRIDITVNELDRHYNFIANLALGWIDVIIHQDPGTQPYIEAIRQNPFSVDATDKIFIEETYSGIMFEVPVTLSYPYISGFGFESSMISLDSSNGYSTFVQIVPYETGKEMEFELASCSSALNDINVTVNGTQVHIISNTGLYEPDIGIVIKEKNSGTTNSLSVTVYDMPLQSITPDVTELTFTKGVSSSQTIMLELEPGSSERNLTCMTMDPLAADFEFEIEYFDGSTIPLAVRYYGGSTTGSFTLDIYDTNTQIHADPITIKVEEEGQEEPTKPYYVEYTVHPFDDTDPLNKTEDGAYFYLPLILNRDEEEYAYHTNYESVEIILKDGSITNDLTTAVGNIEKIKVYYTANAITLRFVDYAWTVEPRVNTVNYLKTDNFTTMYEAFANCTLLGHINTEGWNTTNVTNMSGMFKDCLALTSLDLSSFNTSNVASMHAMFSNCSLLTSLDVSSWDTSNVNDMYGMFRDCSALTSLDLSSFNTSNVASMHSMFYGCSSLTSLDLSNWDTSNVISMDGMFGVCSALTSLDVSSWDTSNVISMDGMFEGVNITSWNYDGTNYANWTLTEEQTGYTGTFPWNEVEEPKKEYKCPKCLHEFDSHEAEITQTGSLVRVKCPNCGKSGQPAIFSPRSIQE